MTAAPIRAIPLRLPRWRSPGRTAGLIALAIVACVVAVAILAPVLSPYDPIKLDLSQKLLAPGGAHILGTDQTGRDVLSRLIWGARPSLLVGSVAVLIALLGGVPLGLLAGFFSGGIVEEICMRTVEILASIPLLIWAIAIVGIFGVGTVSIGRLQFPNEAKLIALVGVLNIPGIARITHAVALIESRSDYVKARRVQGASAFRIILSDVLPNCLAPIVVQATLLIAIGIVIEASMSFVGLGVQPPWPSWGSMLADARNYVLTGEWWLPVLPGLCISITVIGINLLGDSLRDVLDPRNRSVAGQPRLRSGVA
jgi:peptide/nickel transport system permease protein